MLVTLGDSNSPSTSLSVLTSPHHRVVMVLTVPIHRPVFVCHILFLYLLLSFIYCTNHVCRYIGLLSFSPTGTADTSSAGTSYHGGAGGNASPCSSHRFYSMDLTSRYGSLHDGEWGVDSGEHCIHYGVCEGQDGCLSGFDNFLDPSLDDPVDSMMREYSMPIFNHFPSFRDHPHRHHQQVLFTFRYLL